MMNQHAIWQYFSGRWRVAHVGSLAPRLQHIRRPHCSRVVEPSDPSANPSQSCVRSLALAMNTRPRMPSSPHCPWKLDLAVSGPREVPGRIAVCRMRPHATYHGTTRRRMAESETKARSRVPSCWVKCVRVYVRVYVPSTAASASTPYAPTCY